MFDYRWVVSNMVLLNLKGIFTLVILYNIIFKTPIHRIVSNN